MRVLRLILLPHFWVCVCGGVGGVCCLPIKSLAWQLRLRSQPGLVVCFPISHTTERRLVCADQSDLAVFEVDDSLFNRRNVIRLSCIKTGMFL